MTLTEEDAMQAINRRDFLKLTGLGGAVFVSGLAGCSTMGAATGTAAGEDFFFVHKSRQNHKGKSKKGPLLIGTLTRGRANLRFHTCV